MPSRKLLRLVKLRRLAAAALAIGATSFFASGAHAAECTALGLPSPVYLAGSTAIGPVIVKIGKFLAVQSTPITLVYAGSGSCAGVASAVAAVTDATKAALVTPAGKTNYFMYWDSTGTQQTCDITPSDGGAPVLPNIGLSDVFAESCQSLPNGLASLGITDHLGPVQAMTFVVPASSTESSISAAAAYFVFGFGSNSGIVPWTDVTSIYQRGPTSGTQTMIAKAITVPSTRWYGVTANGTSGMIASLTAANTALNAKAIGVLGAADLDPLRRAATPANPVPIRELAYKHFGQNCGYLPDASTSSFEKRNVRDGHYAIWGPLHVLPLPSNDSQVQANINTIVGYLTGTAQTGSLDVIASEAQSGLVPQCAMRVQRSTEVGPMKPFTPTSPCGCYYEFIANGTSSCQSCQKNLDCPTNYTCETYNGRGYCEPP